VSPLEQIERKYAEKGVDFYEPLARNMARGFVYSTPSFFVMGCPDGDSWFLEAFAGDMAAVWAIMPYALPYVSFERFDGERRRYRLDVLQRLTLRSSERHETATA
jgi:hypothetical protein